MLTVRALGTGGCGDARPPTATDTTTVEPALSALAALGPVAPVLRRPLADLRGRTDLPILLSARLP